MATTTVSETAPAAAIATQTIPNVTTSVILKGLAVPNGRAQDTKPNNTYKHLTPEDADHFLKHGWLHIPQSIKPEYLDWADDLWDRIGYDKEDKSTWHSEYLHLPRHREVSAEEFAPEAWAKTVEICGGEHMIHPVRERCYGDAFIVNFGSEEKAKSTEVYRPQERAGWHIDDDWYRLFLDSSGNAMTVVHCFSDIPERAGGTWLCEDGISSICQYLYDRPEGLDPPVDGQLFQHCQSSERFSQIKAKKGDVFLLHGLLPHTAAPNYLHYARIITNPHVCLAQPHNLDRPDGNYTLLEQVILRAMGKPSLPELKPTRSREYYYPRNAGFKRAYAFEELKRMEEKAKQRGSDPSSVLSVYRKIGSKEWDEFEIRNGFREPINTLLLEQHNL